MEIELENGHWYLCHSINPDYDDCFVERVLLRHKGSWHLSEGNPYTMDWTIKPICKMVGRLQDDIEFDSIKLKIFDKDFFWLERPDGEGMQVSRKQLEILLDEFYKANF